jgi:hypothetical protein
MVSFRKRGDLHGQSKENPRRSACGGNRRKWNYSGIDAAEENSQKTVAVTPVSGLLQEFYTPSTTLDGTITSSATQTVNGDKDLIIDQIYVTKGDAVKKGDPLVSFDTTLVEMELNIAKLKNRNWSRI